MSTRQHSEDPKPEALPPRLPPQEKAEALMALIEEAMAVQMCLQLIAEHLHGSSELTRACRGILRDLYRLGPRTVPQLARNRPVSRQNVLMLVHRLASEDLVAFSRNPAHKRSHLVSLTDRGKELLEQMWGREMALLSHLDLDLPLDDLRAATGVLHHLRTTFEQLPLPDSE
ncbi:MarR family transcriptional regulator [Ktedonosporobacter rubrisoli]|uniref:MarR family transcriptional regulator n=1 Tax=Ktedonosporobacter rubrisoli TaxID=2509675 RepID=A0A4P6JJE6_KTERU|nr:MarR family transcriptional regulator [Ktedonosporobacter rubrisoli]QBD74786.1 MarR family transcriptional regulator [Ktedonosporobacter rubrisoli]